MISLRHGCQRDCLVGIEQQAVVHLICGLPTPASQPEHLSQLCVCHRQYRLVGTTIYFRRHFPGECAASVIVLGFLIIVCRKMCTPCTGRRRSLSALHPFRPLLSHRAAPTLVHRPPPSARLLLSRRRAQAPPRVPTERVASRQAHRSPLFCASSLAYSLCYSSRSARTFMILNDQTCIFSHRGLLLIVMDAHL